jgi:hypothetical protein
MTIAPHCRSFSRPGRGCCIGCSFPAAMLQWRAILSSRIWSRTALVAGGFEVRGSVVRLTMTMRGGDRPKNAHEEFSGVSVMPRSMWEPWVIARKPLEGRVQDNLRMWKTGGWRRISADRPFGDVIRSSPATQRERRIANHPSLKPQSFLRQIVYASLRLEKACARPFCGIGFDFGRLQCGGLLQHRGGEGPDLCGDG